MNITHNAAQHAFVIGQAHLDYQMPSTGVINFVATEVPDAEQGQGEGSALAKAGLDYARQHNLKVIATCPFIASYIQQHDEYADLLAK